MLVPFALEVRRRYLRGETIGQLSVELGIPADRIEQRLRAAAAYMEQQRNSRLSRPATQYRRAGSESRIRIQVGSCEKLPVGN